MLTIKHLKINLLIIVIPLVTLILPYAVYLGFDSEQYYYLFGERKSVVSFSTVALILLVVASLVIGGNVCLILKRRFSNCGVRVVASERSAVKYVILVLLFLVIAELVEWLTSLYSLFSQFSAEELKRSIESPTFYFASDIALPICSWVLLSASPGSKNNKYAWYLFCVMLITALAEMARFRILPLFILFFLIKKKVRYLIFALLGLFILTAAIRGDALTSVVSYVIPNYERLTRIVENRLTYPFNDSLYNCCAAIVQPPILKRFFPEFEPESRFIYVFEQTRSLNAYGLNGLLIWPTAIGYVYTDLGWISLLYFLIFGFMFATVAAASREGYGWANALFPYALLAYGGLGMDNFIMYPNVDIYLFCALLIYLYERMVSRRAYLSHCPILRTHI